jgi:hypothetical protein
LDAKARHVKRRTPGDAAASVISLVSRPVRDDCRAQLAEAAPDLLRREAVRRTSIKVGNWSSTSCGIEIARHFRKGKLKSVRLAHIG